MCTPHPFQKPPVNNVYETQMEKCNSVSLKDAVKPNESHFQVHAANKQTNKTIPVLSYTVHH